nr:MAG TPA: Sister chromatid cohesion protein DCC1-helix, DNA repair, cell cycle.29A [Caudoviricetes sp.]
MLCLGSTRRIAGRVKKVTKLHGLQRKRVLIYVKIIFKNKKMPLICAREKVVTL